MLLFVHTPKCAGGSVRRLLLESPSTKDRVVIDDDWVFALPPGEQIQRLASYALKAEPVPEGSIVCGHYYPAKYLGAGDALSRAMPLVTILRHPLARMKSHFHFFRDSDTVKTDLAIRVREEEWDFERFALGPEFQNFMTRMMTGISLDHFDFIGIQEELRGSLEIINERYGLGLDLTSMPERNLGHYDREEGVTPALREKIGHHHALDYALYEEVLRRF